MAQTLIEWTWRRITGPQVPLQFSLTQLAHALKIGATWEPRTGGQVPDLILPGFTFNPWIGCTKVSPGCANCYAADLDERRFSKTLGGATKDQPIIHFGRGAPRHRTATWGDPLRWNRQAQELGVTLRVFSASLGDWLDDEVPIEWFADFLALIAATPWLDWILVTKRLENWAKRMNAASGCFDIHTVDGKAAWGFGAKWYISGEAPPNVWLLTSVEDQPRADLRIPALLQIPAVVHGLSLEPLLGPVDLCGWLTSGGCSSPGTAGEVFHGHRQLDWCIVGGESGDDVKAPDGRVIRSPRPMHPDWARSLRDQCAAAGVPFFFKQWGEWCPSQAFNPEVGKAYHLWRAGKKSAGRRLDGVEHHAAPEPRLRADDAHKSALPAISSLTK